MVIFKSAKFSNGQPRFVEDCIKETKLDVKLAYT